MVSGQKKRYTEDGFNLDMTYVTPRIIAMSYPASCTLQKIYRNSCSKVADMLSSNHAENYWVINLSEQQYTSE